MEEVLPPQWFCDSQLYSGSPLTGRVLWSTGARSEWDTLEEKNKEKTTTFPTSFQQLGQGYVCLCCPLVDTGLQGDVVLVQGTHASRANALFPPYGTDRDGSCSHSTAPKQQWMKSHSSVQYSNTERKNALKKYSVLAPKQELPQNTVREC